MRFILSQIMKTISSLYLLYHQFVIFKCLLYFLQPQVDEKFNKKNHNNEILIKFFLMYLFLTGLLAF
jgi:hypothetical protein